jgi:biotin carboxylase
MADNSEPTKDTLLCNHVLAVNLQRHLYAVAATDHGSFRRAADADEAYQIGKGRGSLEAYLSIDEVIRIAKEHRIDAIHPGYGFLSESPEFVHACALAGLIFIGPCRLARRRAYRQSRRAKYPDCYFRAIGNKKTRNSHHKLSFLRC